MVEMAVSRRKPNKVEETLVAVSRPTPGILHEGVRD
jgi:hypothetical protein